MSKRVIEWEKFRRLELKYTKLCQKQIILDNIFKRFEKMPQAVINLRTNDGLYLLRTHSGNKGIIYLKSTKIKKGHCDCCGKRRITTAHHIVPRRLKSINSELSNIRIRVCNECDLKIHPENGYAESKILRQKERQTKLLQKKLNLKNKPFIKIISTIFKDRLSQLKINRRENVLELVNKKEYSKIPFLLNRNTGRVREISHLRTLINAKMQEYFRSA